MRIGQAVVIGILLLASCGKGLKFQQMKPDRTGITFENTITEADSLNVLTYENLYNGAGIGAGDLNNDGLADLVFAGNQVSPRVYLNKGNFTFDDITAAFPEIGSGQWFSGVALADVNGDGWLDVYITATGSRDRSKNKNRLWINQGIDGDGGPTFLEKGNEFGVACDDQSVAAAFLDYDRDGDLDLYVLNNTVNQRMNTSYRKKITDGSAENNDRLYRNNGNNSFTDVTKEAGITIEGFGLGVAVGDVNADGFPDLYISNDYLSNDVLYINQGNGIFKNEIARYISCQTTSSMGNDMADVNNDGLPDILTLDMLPQSYAKRKQTINGFSYLYYQMDDSFGYEHQYLRNMLHVHNGFLRGELLPFSETGQLSGVYQSDWSWSPLLADFDNDGDRDLLIANGYPRDLTDKDWASTKNMDKGFMSGDPELIRRMPQVKVPNLAFENQGNQHFKKTTRWIPDQPSYSNGAVFVDLDNDGDLDYVTNNLNDPAFVLRNRTVEQSHGKAGFLRLMLKGNAPNTAALGARIDLWCRGEHQCAWHFLTRGYASSVDPVLHFGLATATVIDSLIITWPATGYITMMKNVKPRQTLVITEQGSVPARPAAVKETLFTSIGILPYHHLQNDFVDFFMGQKVIPRKFSQIGPRIAHGDLDGDGMEDLVTGATNIAPTGVFLWKGDGFVPSEMPGLTEMREYTESDVAIADMDKDGDMDVITVAGGYDSRMENERQRNLYMAVAGGYDALNERVNTHCLFLNQGGKFEKIVLPVPSFLASVVRVCDYNHDGFPDLFIGCRVNKGKFPSLKASWVVRNDHGKMIAGQQDKFDLGMVTDAVWTDIDGDGWEDLLVARDWNCLTVLKNKSGHLEPVDLPELSKVQGVWYSLIAADFDKDGDDDYIAGNMGDNHRFQVSDEFPMNIYALDLDMDGILDPILTAWWPDEAGKMTKYPVNYLDELKEQSSFFKMKFRDYTTFSRTSMEQMIDESTAERLAFRLRVNTTSSYFIRNTKGVLSFEKLPQAVQVAPLTAMTVCDVNHDGYPDVIAGGNDYGWDVSTGYMDANKGLLLLNRQKDGKGGPAFEVVPTSVSGLFMPGMVQSLFSLNQNGLKVVAGINRSEARVFLLKEK
jgi:enediyne biosynthesis protein E4